MDMKTADALAMALANPVVEIPATQPSPEYTEDPIPEKNDDIVPLEPHEEPKVEVSEVPEVPEIPEEKTVAPVAPVASAPPALKSGDATATERYLKEVGGLGRVVV